MSRQAVRLPADDVREYTMTLREFKAGTMTLLEENRTPPGAVVQSDNAVQVQDGVWAPKWGSAYYSTDLPSYRKGSPTVVTNLITNPSFETGITGWTAFNGGTPSQSSAKAQSGTYSCAVATTSGANKGVQSPLTSLAGAAVGSLHIMSAYVWAPVGVTVTVEVDQYTAASAFISATSGTVVGNGAWQRVSVSVTVAGTATQVRLFFFTNATTTFYVDAVLLELNSSPSTYFDGSSTGTVAIDYAWTGTAHASTSTRSTYVYAPYSLDGAFEAVDSTGATLILEVAGGKLYRSVNGGTKTEVTISPGTLTAGHDCFFLQIRNYVYIGNKYDPLVRYDTVAQTAASYTALSTPAAPTLAKTGLAGTNYRAYYVIVASNLVGTTVGSSEAVVQVGKVRDEWATSTTAQNVTDFVTVTITRVTGATRYSIFYSDASGKELYLDSVADPGSGATFDYVDRGEVPINDFVELPNDNTTGGPKLGFMELSSNRIWGLDGNNRQRVNWSGVGQYTGVFSPYYGGGYVDLELGGREQPVQIVHFRDGRGTAMATVLTTDPQGNGSTWQITLETVTVGSVSFLVPNPVKVVGSIGAAGPRAACKVVDDIIFGNAKGMYSFGSQPSLVNVLATREISSNIRPSWRALDGSSISGIATYYYDAKLFVAVPNNDTNNSEIWIRDTEKRNWQIGWKGVGIKAFFEATDSTGHTHLLGVPVSGSRLIEFSSAIKGDLGVAFTTTIKTGQVAVNPKNHNQFAQIDRLYVELGTPISDVTIDFYGYDYKKGFVFLKSLVVEGEAVSQVDWSYQWSTQQWSYIATVATPVATSIVRRYVRLNKLINSLQYVVSASGAGAYFEILELGAEGYTVKVEPPRTWKAIART